MRYQDRYISKDCNNDYFDYEIDKNGKIIITNYYIQKRYDYYSLVREFLYKHANNLSAESLIKHVDIFTKSEYCKNIIISVLEKETNIDVLKVYIPYINVIRFMNNTNIEDEEVYKVLITGNLKDSHLNDCKIPNAYLFGKYFKEMYQKSIKLWNRWDYQYFVWRNRHLTYENFFKEYVDIFELKYLFCTGLLIPINVVEDVIKKEYLSSDKYKNSEHFKGIVNSYSFSEKFVIDNLDALKNHLDWRNITFSIDKLIDIEKHINHNILECYRNEKNVFPINKTIEYIKKYLNIEEFVQDTEDFMNSTEIKSNEIINNKWFYNINIFLTYKYINSDIIFALKLMLEIMKTCVTIREEYERLVEIGICIKEAKEHLKTVYIQKIYELKELFNDIKNDIS